MFSERFDALGGRDREVVLQVLEYIEERNETATKRFAQIEELTNELEAREAQLVVLRGIINTVRSAIVSSSPQLIPLAEAPTKAGLTGPLLGQSGKDSLMRGLREDLESRKDVLPNPEVEPNVYVKFFGQRMKKTFKVYSITDLTEDLLPEIRRQWNLFIDEEVIPDIDVHPANVTGRTLSAYLLRGLRTTRPKGSGSDQEPPTAEELEDMFNG